MSGNPRKERKQSEILRKVAPAVFDRKKNEELIGVADKITYVTEIVFVVFLLITILNIFIKNKDEIIRIHTTRASVFTLVAGIAAFLLYHGLSIPEVNIWFYILEIILIIIILVATLVAQSEQLSQKPTPEVSDIFGILISCSLLIFNFYVFGKEIYRLYIGKDTTPINTVFTFVTAISLSLISIITIYKTYNNK